MATCFIKYKEVEDLRIMAVDNLIGATTSVGGCCAYCRTLPSWVCMNKPGLCCPVSLPDWVSWALAGHLEAPPQRHHTVTTDCRDVVAVDGRSWHAQLRCNQQSRHSGASSDGPGWNEFIQAQTIKADWAGAGFFISGYAFRAWNEFKSGSSMFAIDLLYVLLPSLCYALLLLSRQQVACIRPYLLSLVVLAYISRHFLWALGWLELTHMTTDMSHSKTIILLLSSSILHPTLLQLRPLLSMVLTSMIIWAAFWVRAITVQKPGLMLEAVAAGCSIPISWMSAKWYEQYYRCLYQASINQKKGNQSDVGSWASSWLGCTFTREAEERLAA